MKNKLKPGQTIRYRSGTSWLYGVIEKRLTDYDAYTIKINDGSTIDLEDHDLQVTPVSREDKPWPEEEDCTHCPGRQGEAGPHKFGCAIGGARRIVMPLNAVRRDK
jgi:hypothetical protein